MKNSIEMIEQARQDGEPVFVLRAKDEYSLGTLDAYILTCMRFGASPEFLAQLNEKRREFVFWRAHHQKKVRKPD